MWQLLVKEIHKGNIVADANVDELLNEVEGKRWNVRNDYPTIDLEVLENYLARYINRISISKSRFEYLAEQEEVHQFYRNIRNRKRVKPHPYQSSQLSRWLP